MFIAIKGRCLFFPLDTLGEINVGVAVNCQRVRPSEDRRPDEAADYRAARRCVGEKISETLLNVMQCNAMQCNVDRDVSSWCDVSSQSARLFAFCGVEGFDTHFDIVGAVS